LRKIYGPTYDQGEWRRKHNKEIRDLNNSADIVSEINTHDVQHDTTCLLTASLSCVASGDMSGTMRPEGSSNGSSKIMVCVILSKHNSLLLTLTKLKKTFLKHFSNSIFGMANNKLSSLLRKNYYNPIFFLTLLLNDFHFFFIFQTNSFFRFIHYYYSSHIISAAMATSLLTVL
jgi:hypothetical protein